MSCVTLINNGRGPQIVTVIGRPGPQGPPGPPGPGSGPGGGPVISDDLGNRAVAGSDGGVFVPDDLIPDPLAYYILAKA